MEELNETTVRRMYEEELRSALEIARHFGVSERTVSRRMAKWGIVRRPQGRPSRPVIVTPAQRQEVLTAVRTGGVQRAAKYYKYSRPLVHAILGIRPLPRGTKRRVTDDALVRKEREAGASIAQLAAKWSCSERTIRRSLQRTNVVFLGEKSCGA